MWLSIGFEDRRTYSRLMFVLRSLIFSVISARRLSRLTGTFLVLVFAACQKQRGGFYANTGMLMWEPRRLTKAPKYPALILIVAVATLGYLSFFQLSALAREFVCTCFLEFSGCNTQSTIISHSSSYTIKNGTIPTASSSENCDGPLPPPSDDNVFGQSRRPGDFDATITTSYSNDAKKGDMLIATAQI